jgi:G3E family GTPase
VLVLQEGNVRRPSKYSGRRPARLKAAWRRCCPDLPSQDLAAPHGKKLAILVNELGRISIDTQLIVGRGGDVLELAGGCVCCKVDIKNDLWDGIGDIVARSSPDCVVLETTGIAEPVAILDGLVRVPDAVRDRIQPAGVICVVDAEAGAGAVEVRDEAREQAISADRVMLAKLDVAAGDAVRRTHAILDAVAPHAERAGFPAGEAGARAMTAWVIEPRKLRAWTEHRRERAHGPGDEHDHGQGHGRGHHHANQIVAVTFCDDAPLVGERVLAYLESLGERLIRAKGLLAPA